jgi:actin-like ATPase involved in cell morphogenesis
MYTLGIDLGTTFTAAATWRDGHVEVAPLGGRAATIPSVVLLREDETFVTGETAHRRGLTEPQRVAREFKRRLGDTTPILLGGVPYSAEALMARLLRAVIEDVTAREGGPPSAICISHPANWGQYKIELLQQAVSMADVEPPVTFTTEPEAAAAFYARQQRIDPGAVVAVYDLGGGTFDAAVLRKTESGFEILGRPEGIERLGGIDFDAAVFNHVRQSLGGKLAELDEDDSTVIAAVGRLREECTDAKEALSSDTDVSIPVLLPNLATEIRLTRTQLEGMVRPALLGTIEALQRALRSAGVEPEQLHSVLLVGGSSRMPVVAQLVGAELRRPVAVDAHPKHVVALGGAWLASRSVMPAESPRPAERVIATATVISPPVPSLPFDQPPPPRFDQAPRPPAGVARVAAAPPGEVRPARVRPAAGRRGRALVIAGAALAMVLAAGAVAWAVTNDDDPATDPRGQESPPAEPSTTPGEEPLSPDEECTDAIRQNSVWVCLTSASFEGEQLVVEYEAEWAGEIPNKSFGIHLHLYGGDGTNPPEETMGNQAPAPGVWKIEDQNPAVLTADEVADYVGDAPKVCARIADGEHGLVADSYGTYHTGNCVPISR